MTYNMYNTQLAASWVQRVNKEEKTAQLSIEKQVMKEIEEQRAVQQAGRSGGSVASYASSGSKAPSGFTSKTSFLKSRLERLESDLAEERASRKQVEADLHLLRVASQPSTPQPGSPHKSCSCHSPRK